MGLTAAAHGETLRVATWHLELQRDGPGLFLRDLIKGEVPKVDAAAEILAVFQPDILLLTSVDWDYDLVAAQALADRFEKSGVDYPYLFALRPNTGMPPGLDMDGDGRLGGPRDAQGYGFFPGQGGMLLLSRVPVETALAEDLSGILWTDLPGALLPIWDGALFPSPEAIAAQRLSQTGHWVIPVRLSDGTLVTLLAFAAGTPVFDGLEDRNGRRNHDEVVLWSRWLDGTLDGHMTAPGPVIVLGDANLDPVDGEGLRIAMRGLLGHERLQDPEPLSSGGTLAAMSQGGVNTAHEGDPALDTADWDDAGPGNLRVSYVLPDRSFNVVDAGVVWPAPGEPLAEAAEAAGRHKLVWVDIAIP
ncbi:MAG: endonuclease/exonuclease/phosphatase family protein [Pseudomonadota bacterium]